MEFKYQTKRKKKKKKNRMAFLPACERGKDPPAQGCPSGLMVRAGREGRLPWEELPTTRQTRLGPTLLHPEPRSTYCWECQSAILFLSLTIWEGDLHFLSQLAACTSNSNALQAHGIDCHPVISVPAQWCKGFQIPSLGLSFSSSSFPRPRTRWASGSQAHFSAQLK